MPLLWRCGCGRCQPAPKASTSPPPCQHQPPPCQHHQPQVRTAYVAETNLPTRHGTFRLRGYRHSIDGGKTFVEPAAIISGQVEGKEDVVLRVHDACFTSEVLGSLKCDCAEQLQLAMAHIRANAPGLVIYLWQEGRGIGLANKIAAYRLQEQGLDTVDANRALGLPDDLREYTSVRNILKELGVRSVRLMTNNPRKIRVLAELGVKVTGRVACQVQAGAHNKGYLEAKAQRMAHMIDGRFYEESSSGGESGESSGSSGSSSGASEVAAAAATAMGLGRGSSISGSIEAAAAAAARQQAHAGAAAAMPPAPAVAAAAAAS